MKTILKTSLLAIFLLIGVVANAQEQPLTFGVKAGMNLSNLSGDGVEGTDAKVGFNVGLTVDYALTQDLFLMSGLEFTTKGAKASFSDSYEGVNAEMNITINSMYLQLPVHAGYKFDVSEGMKLNLHAGPYVAYGIGGKSKTKIKGDIAGRDINLEPEGDVDMFGDKGMANRFDFGLGLGVGAEFGKFGVGLGYDLGLTNIAKDSKEKVRNMNAYLTVGYKF